MAKPPRDYTSFGSSVYFVTGSTWGHRSLFQTDRMGCLFTDTLFHYRREAKVPAPRVRGDAQSLPFASHSHWDSPGKNNAADQRRFFVSREERAGVRH